MKKREVMSVALPKHLAFRSATFAVLIMSKISLGVGHAPAEVRCEALNEVVQMEWWQPECPECGRPYRYVSDEQKLCYNVDKSDPESPKCSCGKVWSWAGLYMAPGEMEDAFEWDYSIKGNATELGHLIERVVYSVDSYMKEMFKAAADVRRRTGR